MSNGVHRKPSRRAWRDSSRLPAVLRFGPVAIPDPSAPVNTVAPTIQGTPAVYQTLTVNNGSWSGYPSPSFTYQWRNAGVDIGGATGSSYVVLEGDYTDSITVFVTGTNTEGSANGTSAAVVIDGAAPVNTVAPVASGGTGLGDAISTTSGTWTGYPAPTFSYQATRNGVAIDGATASTRNVAVADSSADMGWLVTASNAAGSTSAPSNTITAQTFTAPVISGTPTITGLAEVGETVTFVPAAVTGNPTPTRTWQPMSDGVDFGAAQSGDTYVIPTGVGGTDFGVLQVETNALGFDAEVSAVVGVPAPSIVYEEFDTLFWTSAIQDPSGFVGSGVDANGKSLPVASPGGTPTIRFERTYFPSYGQSLSVGGSGFPALSTEASAVDEMFVRGMRPEDDYYLESAATWYASVVPAAEGISPRYATQGETPGRGFADALREFVTSHYGAQPDLKFHLSAPGQGGIEIIKLMKGNGTGYYERMIAQMQALVTLKSGIETVGMEAMPFIHGERDYLLSTTGANYKTRLADICTTIVADAKTEFGQTNDVQVLGTQVASHIANANQVNAQIALAQLEADDEIANYHLVCPIYQLPFKGADVHLNALGYIWMAGYLAAAYKSIITDQSTWEIVKPLSYSTVGSVCEITYNVPTVYDLTNELVFDTTQVASQTNHGFRLFDVSGVEQTISSVAISAPNKVVITAAATITAGSYIDYARQGDATKGLGNLRDKAGDVRRSQILNFDMPLHNWAVISKSGALA